MSLDSVIDALKQGIDNILHVEWLSTAITIFVVVVITLVLSRLATKLLRKVLHMDVNPLPTLSIFINLARVTIWVIGLCVILSSCFNINVSAAITALGIGGIAISLGFQSTLSNLIGGLQISLAKLIKPGDNIKVGSDEGIVHDITWRNTSIIAPNGDNILIPNSVINSEALTKMKRDTDIRIDIIVPHSDESLDHVATKMEQAVDEALTKITVLDKPAEIYFSEVTRDGYRGVLYFTVIEGTKSSIIKDTALRAISAYASRASSRKHDETPGAIDNADASSQRSHRRKIRLSRREKRKMVHRQRRQDRRSRAE